MIIAPTPIRLFCDAALRTDVIDLNTDQGALFYRGDDIEIDIGIGEGGALLTGISNITSVTCQMFASENDTNAPMMSATVLAAAMNLTLTQAQWSDNTNSGSPQTAPTLPTSFQHAAFIFHNSQTAVSLIGQASQNFWLRITALTSDSPAKIITLLDGPITVRDGPINGLAAPIAANFRTFLVNGVSTLQLWDPVTQHFYNLEIDTAAGVRTLSLGDTAY